MSMLPEIIIIICAFLLIAMDLVFLEKAKYYLVPIALVGLIAAGVVLVSNNSDSLLLGGRFVNGAMHVWLKLIFLLATFFVIILIPETTKKNIMPSLSHVGEFLAILMFTVSGMMFLVSCQDLITLYVSLELATIPLMVLSAWNRDDTGGEGAIKYLVIGALASAFMLYGFGLIYALSGELNIAAIHPLLQNGTPALYLAAALITAGIGFKLTLFPFHMWAPDAYQGAPILVTAYLSGASKAAGLVVALQIFYRVFGYYILDWAPFVALMATLTMTLGNIVAVLQENLKRFMAFSAISQAGYLILGFLGNSGADVSAMIFYMLVYVFTNLAVFTVLILHVHQTGKESIGSLRGLSRLNPGLALVLMIGLFGLAGIPPLAGFIGKFFLFNVAAKSGYYWLVVLAVLNSTVSLYYYLRLVRQMYIEAPGEGDKPLKVQPLTLLSLGFATIGMLVLGVIPYFYEQISVDAASWLAFLG